MKIVIDIDNETYARIQALVNADYFEHDICGYSMQRIANGTPYEERPQGEWLTAGEEQGALGMIYKIKKCSICGWEHSLVIPDNFCPNCGADMTKGVENEVN